MAKIFILVTLFLIISSGSYAASKAATKFINDFQSFLNKKSPSIKIKLIRNKPYDLLGFRKVVVMIKNTRRVYLANGKLIISELFDVKNGYNILEKR